MRKNIDCRRIQERQAPLHTRQSLSGTPFTTKRRAVRTVSILMLLACGSLTLLGSCSMPISIGPDHFGIGFFQAESEEITPEVSYRKIEGLGLLFAYEHASLGYAKHEVVSAKLEGKSYSVSTPLADFAVGEDAENAGIEYVLRDNQTIVKGGQND